MNPTLEADLTIGVTLLLVGLCVPLILRKIPMNEAYGFRVAAAFKSERHWYDINAAGGKIVTAAVLPILAAGVAKLFVPESTFVYFNWASVILPLGIGAWMYHRLGWKKLKD